ncbi:MAG: creatininase family protein [Chitinophagaceae bacterium]
MIWDQLSSKQIAALDKTIPVLLNLCATEQHGAHLPLSTDRLIGEHFSALLNKEMMETILILPSVPIGCSDHHMEFPGSLSLSHATFSAVVQDIVRSVLHHGFYKIILLNSHGGNQGIMQVIVEQLGYANPPAHIVGVTWWNLVKEELKKITETGPGGTGHACEFETSIIQVIAAELVNNSEMAKGANTTTFPWAEGDMLQGPKASYYRTMKSMTPNGVFGNPVKATAEKGRRITAVVVEALKQLVRDIYSIDQTER